MRDARSRWVLLLALLSAPSLAHGQAARSVAARTWTAVETAHLEVLTDAGRAAGERVALRLEDLRAALAVLAPALVVDAPAVQVIVFRDAALARAYAPTWRGLHDDVSGFFHAGPDRRRVLFVDDQGRTPSVAQHEYLHSLLDAALPDAPLWLNEGLAEYFSTFTADDGRARAGAPVRAHLDWLDAHDLMPMTELFAVGQGSPAYHEGDRRGTFYAQSWAFVHLLLSGSEGDLAKLQRVLVAARDGERFDDVFTREFGNESALLNRLIAHLEHLPRTEREWSMPDPTRAAGPGTPRVRDRVAPSGVLASLGLEFLARPVAQREEAEEHLREALALDPRQPDALAGLGWLELMRGRRESARGWFERALEATPTSVTAVRVLASQLLLDVSRRQAQEERKAAGLFARGAIERALAVSPGDPELLSLLARSWVVWYADDPEPGYAASIRAARALPGRLDVELDLLALEALTGRDDEASALYERRFRRAADPETRRSARTGLLAGDVFRANRSLAQGDAAAAEARLEAARDRVADDPALAAEADRYLENVRAALRGARETAQRNRAIAEYNAGVKHANVQRYVDAAAAFRRAAAASAEPAFQRRSLELAARMEQRATGERALTLARKGQVSEAIAILERMDRSAMDAEERRWLDENLARLRSRRP